MGYKVRKHVVHGASCNTEGCGGQTPEFSTRPLLEKWMTDTGWKFKFPSAYCSGCVLHTKKEQGK